MLTMRDFEAMPFEAAQQRVSAPMIVQFSLGGAMRPETPLGSYEDLLRLDENNVKRGVKPQEWPKAVREIKAKRKHVGDADPITQEDFVKGEILVELRKCGHVFKPVGLKKWFKKEHLCPVCRADVLE
eukprot:TRINITY_DN13238_c0_g3_i1.p1 TRINITY_DN13238_c0_g3~~TRINITY_DN13238_c0_g3_i1.p1  ORF type:complete len:128 (+),score=21.41 TRINITY_DN13238_c0_g3_i1:44-427(+)